MYGWSGKLLYVNLSSEKIVELQTDQDMMLDFIGGRGFAIKLLWDELPPGTDPFSPGNMLILATGPLTELPIPSSGKLVLASKSPLTGGYGDGNIGSEAATKLKRTGYDAVIIKGRAKRPVYLYIGKRAEFLDAVDLWGLTTFEAEKRLKKKHGNVGILTIGPAGENLVRFSIVSSQEGRSGGRPGMGAVMGSKNLKAIIMDGNGEVLMAEPDEIRKLSKESNMEIMRKKNYEFWMRQGTMATVEWSQLNSVLPTQNFKEGVFDAADGIDGYAMERRKVSQRGCPNCISICGNVVIDKDEKESEVDYENIAMLGSNIGIGDISDAASLSRMADEYGLDTISLGNVIGFAMEASEKGLIEDKLEWGDPISAKELTRKIAYKEGIGGILAEGVKRAAETIKNGSSRWAMHIKGLEITAYDCHTAIGMALSYATSPIGAHHKDAWVISWEVKNDRFSFSREKAAKVMELQRIRGGLFETLTVCRFPWIELGFGLEWYLRFLKAATGLSYSWDDIYRVADRVFNLIRAFWIREYSGWSRKMDLPPKRWFEEPLTKGPFKGCRLNEEHYNTLLNHYYELRGWDENGIPLRKTLDELGLGYVAAELEKVVRLRDA
jgi:aldehyde:ferredoxin oxidoreductase